MRISKNPFLFLARFLLSRLFDSVFEIIAFSSSVFWKLPETLTRTVTDLYDCFPSPGGVSATVRLRFHAMDFSRCFALFERTCYILPSSEKFVNPFFLFFRVFFGSGFFSPRRRPSRPTACPYYQTFPLLSIPFFHFYSLKKFLFF